MNPKPPHLTLIGPIPDPKGGVSIHISRLYSLLAGDLPIVLVDESSNIKKDIFNIRSLNILKYLSIILSSDIIHIHSGVTLFRVFHLITAKVFFKKTIVTMHSLSHLSPFKIKLNSIFLKLANKIIFVNESIPGKLNIDCKILKEAFIPPILENEPELPSDIENWLSLQTANGRLILAANASHIVMDNNVDLYGFDMCLEAIASLIKEQTSDIALMLVIGASNNDTSLLQKYYDMIDSHNLDQYVLLTTQPVSFVKVIEHANIILRPTSTDGDALTIRESLFLNTPVIASDVVARPSGTITFRTRDQLDFQDKLSDTITALHTQVSPGNHNMSMDEYRSFYLDLYLK